MPAGVSPDKLLKPPWAASWLSEDVSMNCAARRKLSAVRYWGQMALMTSLEASAIAASGLETLSPMHMQSLCSRAWIVLDFEKEQMPIS